MYKIGFIGGGRMACAIIKGIINSKLFTPEEIIVSDKSREVLENLKNTFGINVDTDNSKIVKNSNIILFAVKPFVLRDVIWEIKDLFTLEHTIISIAAGVSIETIEKLAGNIPVIRIMPNTPALINEGMSAVCRGNYARLKHEKIAEDIMKSVGKVIKADEKYIDIITAISGSGPAFYYYFIDEIAKAGQKLGLDYNTCLKLSAQTALGSAEMILNSGINPEQLIADVTTPGGCTAAGNDVLRNKHVSEILYEVIEKTKQKAGELGKNK